MFFAGNDFFGYPSYRAQPQRRQFNYSPSYSFYDDCSDDEADQDYFSHNYRPQSARYQRHQQEMQQKQQEQMRAKQLREQAEKLKKQQEQQELIKLLQQRKELEEQQRKQAEQQAQNKLKEEAEKAKIQEDINLANIEKNLEALSTDESDDNSNDNQKNDSLIIEDVKMNYWEMLGVSPQKNTLKEGFIDENYPENVESQAKQLSSLLKKDINECLRIANSNRNCSIGQLIDIALNGSASF